MLRWLVAAALGPAVLLMHGVFTAPPIASADHAAFWSVAFQQHFDHQNAVPGFPAGSVRAVSICNTLPENELSTALREAVFAWNDASSGAGFQAFWLFGPNESFGACLAQPAITARLGGPADCGGGTACYRPTGLDARGFTTSADLFWVLGWSGNSVGLRAAFAHELGHALGLDEAYRHNPVFACGGGAASVMDALTLGSQNFVTGGCDATSPTTSDSNRVKEIFSLSASQSSPPTPQIIWLRYTTNSESQVVFKAANGNNFTWQRRICGDGSSTGQSASFPYGDNPHIGVANISYAEDGRATCQQIKTSSGASSVVFHTGKRQMFFRVLTAHFMNLYGNFTEEGMFHSASPVEAEYAIRNGELLFSARWVDPHAAFLLCQGTVPAEQGYRCSSDVADSHLPAVFLYREPLSWHRLALSGAGDTDLDGCTDAQESATDPAFGGDRDLHSQWDFYDVPALAPGESTGGTPPDGSIDLQDTLRILAWFGAAPGSLPWDGDLNGNGLPDGEEFARVAGSAPHRPGPTQDVIDTADALINIDSFGHTCF